MYQVFGGLPCESRRTFAALGHPARPQNSGLAGPFRPDPDLVALSSGRRSDSKDCDFIPRSRDRVRFGPSVAGLSDAISRGPAGGGPGRRGAGAGLDHHPCPERAGARRRTEAVGRAGGSDRRRPARRRLGVLGRPSLATRNPRRLADVEISRRDGAERSVLPSLGSAGGVFRALRAADPRLRAGHGGRARDAARPVLTASIFRRCSPGRWRMCCRACSRSRRCTTMPACRITSTSANICGCWPCSRRRSSRSASGRCAAVDGRPSDQARPAAPGAGPT